MRSAIKICSILSSRRVITSLYSPLRSQPRRAAHHPIRPPPSHGTSTSRVLAAQRCTQRARAAFFRLPIPRAAPRVTHNDNSAHPRNDRLRSNLPAPRAARTCSSSDEDNGNTRLRARRTLGRDLPWGLIFGEDWACVSPSRSMMMPTSSSNARGRIRDGVAGVLCNTPISTAGPMYRRAFRSSRREVDDAGYQDDEPKDAWYQGRR